MVYEQDVLNLRGLRRATCCYVIQRRASQGTDSSSLLGLPTCFEPTSGASKLRRMATSSEADMQALVAIWQYLLITFIHDANI